jgi:hypothetical protein
LVSSFFVCPSFRAQLPVWETFLYPVIGAQKLKSRLH